MLPEANSASIPVGIREFSPSSRRTVPETGVREISIRPDLMPKRDSKRREARPDGTTSVQKMESPENS